MNARDEIFKRLAGAFIAEGRANALIDAYAHELAEKIRAEMANHADHTYAAGLYAGALLIDPEAPDVS